MHIDPILNSQITLWVNREIARTGKAPDPNYVCPLFLSWLMRKIDTLHKTKSGQREAHLHASLLLGVHIQHWLGGFRNRILLDRVNGSQRFGDLKESKILETILQRIETNFASFVNAIGPQNSSDAFAALFTANPDFASRLIADVTHEWHQLPPAFKFGLLGGYDAVKGVLPFMPTDDTHADYVAVFCEANQPEGLQLPVRIRKGRVTGTQVKKARRRLRGYSGINILEMMKMIPAYQPTVGGLNMHHGKRGKKGEGDLKKG